MSQAPAPQPHAPALRFRLSGGVDGGCTCLAPDSRAAAGRHETAWTSENRFARPVLAVYGQRN